MKNSIIYGVLFIALFGAAFMLGCTKEESQSPVQTAKEVYQEAEFEELSETGLKARLRGRELKTMEINIKAATYYQLELKKEKGGFFEAIILFDV